MALTTEEKEKLDKLEKVLVVIDADITIIFPDVLEVTVNNVTSQLLRLYYEDCKKLRNDLKAKE